MQNKLDPAEIDRLIDVVMVQHAKEQVTTPDDLPVTFGLVNGKTFTMPLPDGKPIVIPEEWKLPKELRGGSEEKEEGK